MTQYHVTRLGTRREGETGDVFFRLCEQWGSSLEADPPWTWVLESTQDWFFFPWHIIDLDIGHLLRTPMAVASGIFNQTLSLGIKEPTIKMNVSFSLEWGQEQLHCWSLGSLVMKQYLQGTGRWWYCEQSIVGEKSVLRGCSQPQKAPGRQACAEIRLSKGRMRRPLPAVVRVWCAIELQGKYSMYQNKPSVGS